MLVECSTKPGYCKHQHSSILHSSSSKGKLLALIECETNLSSLSLSSSLALLYHWQFSKGKRLSKGRFERILFKERSDFSGRKSTRQSYYPCKYPCECHSWKLGETPGRKNQHSGREFDIAWGFRKKAFWSIDLWRYYDKIFSAFFSRINSQM